MHSPPAPSIEAQAPTSGLAIASLFCGVAGLVSGPITGVPAIIMGHMALGRIKKSGGAIQGRGMALGGLITGYFFTVVVVLIAALAALGFATAGTAINKAKVVSARAAAMSLEMAVQNFDMEYNALPVEGAADTTVDTAASTQLLEVLLGMESRVNPRSIQFLAAREGRNGKDGLVYQPDGQGMVGMFDPWGAGFQVRLDLDGDGKVEVAGRVLDGRRCAVWSNGPDGKAGTEDDIRTW